MKLLPSVWFLERYVNSIFLSLGVFRWLIQFIRKSSYKIEIFTGWDKSHTILNKLVASAESIKLFYPASKILLSYF